MEVMQTEDFEALHQVVLKVVTETINNDGEVPPVVLVARLKDHEITNLQAIDVSPFQAMEDEQHGKDALAAFIQMLSTKEAIDLVAYVSEAWMVMADSKDVQENACPAVPAPGS